MATKQHALELCTKIKLNSSEPKMARINLNYTEEAFLQRSLQEVVLIWNRGTGQADFNLRVITSI